MCSVALTLFEKHQYDLGKKEDKTNVIVENMVRIWDNVDNECFN